MADFTFLFNRKGAIYPLDLTAHDIDVDSPAAELDMARLAASKAKILSDWPANNLLDNSLVHLCSKVIVGNQALVDKVTDTVPNELFVPLFKAALYPVKDYAIDVSETLARPTGQPV